MGDTDTLQIFVRGLLLAALGYIAGETDEVVDAIMTWLFPEPEEKEE